MVSPENTNWIYDYGLIDDIAVPVGNLLTPACVSSWPMQAALNGSASNPCVEPDGSLVDADGYKETGSKKRGRADPGSSTSSKACREKLRRDKLNDKFVELASILEPGRPLKTDKAAILVDAVRMVTQLRTEAQKLKDSSSDLQEKIKELKSEKNELRDEKQRLKAEKEKLEQQVNSMNTQPSFMAPPPAAYPAAAGGQAMGNKLVPIISYPGMGMWQFMPPAAVDTSQDHMLHPPVA
ncbi:transcription factor ILR3-like [Cynara cardunculus var. scolymus]|uniref:transcription factor ILR3-like n=1 Tax=Cynara cardunculus var. scolymus TaxID=59895 RepID=UPI000D628B55|nr:transcription factor ILR3-like [Cynara cardunculus var. scolymus]